MACVLYAMGLCKGKDGDYDTRNAYISEAMGRAKEEIYRLKTDTSASKEPMTPTGASPYPGNGEVPDYEFGR